VIYGCFAIMVVLWWGVTAGAYGQGFRSWQYLLSGIVAFVTLSALAWWIYRLRHTGQAGEPIQTDDKAATATASSQP
jgi:membrane protein implicated in regulation of membrane protease activity